MTQNMNLKQIKYIDIHSHLGFGDYSSDLKEVIQRMKDSDVATITVGTDLESSREAVKIANEFENVWACIGAHPADKRDFVFEEKDFEEMVKNTKVLAIGECGLDYYVHPESKVESEKLKVISNEEKERQKKEFIKQIEFAIKYKKPLMLHVRDGVVSGEAYQDAFNILESYILNHKSILKGNMHFFAGDLEWAKKFIELGLTISFTGVITFPPKTDQPRADVYDIIKNVPLEKIHIETDSPFVAPIPFRGKRNEPTYVIEVAKKIAEIRGEPIKKVQEQLIKNFENSFAIKIN